MKTFLSPLTTEEEAELLQRMAKGEPEAKCRLIEHNMRLVAHVAKKYYNPNDDPEDLLSIGTIGLLKAVDTYDTAKGYKLVTYAARCIDNELLMYFRGRKKQSKDVSLFEPIGCDKEGNQISLYDILEQEEVDIAEQMDQKQDLIRLRQVLPKVLSRREYEIICKRYGLTDKGGYTQKQIASQMGISRSYVSRIEKRALEKLRYAIDTNS